MNAITNPQGNAVATLDTYDPYAAYGHAATASAKAFIIFSKGEYQVGQNKDEVPLGTRFIAGIPHLRIGWKKWLNRGVVDDRMNYLVDPETGKMFNPGPRGPLGDTNQSVWEKNDKGELLDPWQLHNELPLRGVESGTEFAFATGARSSIAAIGELCKTYSKQYRQRPGQAPVIELGRDSYVHKKYGKLYVPVFTIVDWVPETVAEAGPAAPAAATPAEPPAPPPPPKEPEKPRRTRF